MAFIFPDESIGNRLGQGLSQGLSQGLQQLAQMKLKEYQQKQQATGLQQMFPEMKQEGIQALSRLSPENLKYAIPEMLKNVQAEKASAKWNEQYGLNKINDNQGSFGQSTVQPSPTPTSNLADLLNLTPGQRSQDQPIGSLFGQGMPTARPTTQPQEQQYIPGKAGSRALSLGATPKEAMSIEQEAAKSYQQQGSNQIRKQTQIDKSLAKFNDRLDVKIDGAERLKESSIRALELIRSDETRSGLMGLLPLGLTQANAATRMLAKSMEEIVGAQAAMGGSQAAKAKILQARLQKPSLDMPIEAQEEMFMQYITDADKILNQGKIRDELRLANNYNNPAGLDTKINEIYRQRYEQGQSQTGTKPNQQIDQPSRQTTQPNQPNFIPELQNPYGKSFGEAVVKSMGTGLIGKPKDYNEFEKTVRLATGTAGRFAGQAVTGYGDLLAAGLGIGKYLSHGKTPSYGEIQEKYLPFSLPTTEDVARGMSKLTNGWTDPRTSTEKKLYDMAGVAGSLFSPAKLVGTTTKIVSKILGALGAPLKYAELTGKVMKPFTGPWANAEMSLGRALGLAAGSEAAATGVEALGGGPTAQAIARLGVMAIAATKGGRAMLEETEKNNYELSKNLFAQDKVDIKHTIGRITAFENKIIKTGTKDADIILKLAKDQKNALLKSVKKERVTTVTNKLSGATTTKTVTNYKKPVNEVIKMKENLNKTYRQTTRPRVSGEGYFPENLRGELGELIDIIREPINRASRLNKDAATVFATAEEITKGLGQSSKTTRFLTRNANKLGHGGAHSPSYALLGLATGGMLHGIAGLPKAWSLFKTAPGFKMYTDLMKAAAKEQIRPVIQNLAKFDKLANRIK